MSKVKIIANYLPQFHSIPENDKWWGKGFTDWDAVKKATPLFEGHNQPRIPIENNYYDLSIAKNVKKQAQLARQYGIYGFGIYHYWFNKSQNLLTKPAEIILENKDIDINFMFIWDNNSWIRTWSNIRRGNDWAPQFDSSLSENENNSGILAELKYGTQDDWEIHFQWLLKFFKDPRYIKIDNKPMFSFFAPRNNYRVIKQMVAYWDKRAKECGFSGIYDISKSNFRNNNLTAVMDYEPFSSPTLLNAFKCNLKKCINKFLPKMVIADYDRLWKKNLNRIKKINRKDYFFSGFVNYDDTPRRGNKAKIIMGFTPEKFCYYLTELLRICNSQKRKYVFLTAWNEWGEGAYLEPDTLYGYNYLEAVNKALRMATTPKE